MQQQEYFTNAIGQPIPQLYKTLSYELPASHCPAPLPSSKDGHSILQYAGRLLSMVFSVHARQLWSLVRFRSKRTLQSQFKDESLAILAHSSDLKQAAHKAQEYHIPLLQILITSPEGETAVKEKLLFNFAVSHLINQNFVLYGDWEKHEELACFPAEEGKEIKEGFYFRRGGLIYAFIPMISLITASDNDFQENLLKVRNMFYTIGSDANTPPDLTPQTSNSSFCPLYEDSSLFPEYRPQHDEDNFIDSDI